MAAMPTAQLEDPIMLKRLIMLLALGAALVACSPAGGSSDDPSVVDPSVDVPVESMSPEASPSAS